MRPKFVRFSRTQSGRAVGIPKGLAVTEQQERQSPFWGRAADQAAVLRLSRKTLRLAQ